MLRTWEKTETRRWFCGCAQQQREEKAWMFLAVLHRAASRCPAPICDGFWTTPADIPLSIEECYALIFLCDNTYLTGPRLHWKKQLTSYFLVGQDETFFNVLATIAKGANSGVSDVRRPRVDSNSSIERCLLSFKWWRHCGGFCRPAWFHYQIGAADNLAGRSNIVRNMYFKVLFARLC